MQIIISVNNRDAEEHFVVLKVLHEALQSVVEEKQIIEFFTEETETYPSEIEFVKEHIDEILDDQLCEDLENNASIP